MSNVSQLDLIFVDTYRWESFDGASAYPLPNVGNDDMTVAQERITERLLQRSCSMFYLYGNSESAESFSRSTLVLT